MIDGVGIKSLKIVRDDRGAVLRVLRKDDPYFLAFGEAYVSVVNPDIIKGWKLHTTNTGNISVPHGRVRFVMHDLRDGSATKGETQEIFLSPTMEEYRLLTIPPGVAYAFQNISTAPSLILNVPTEAWREGEGSHLPIERIPFVW